MSWGTCYKSNENTKYTDTDYCNNAFPRFPVIMNDCRFFTAYDSSEVIRQKIMNYEKINNNWDYRRYLQNNASEIMKYNNIESYCDLAVNPGTTFKQNADEERRCIAGYGNSDLKNYYLSRQQLNAKMTSPSIYLSQT